MIPQTILTRMFTENILLKVGLSHDSFGDPLTTETYKLGKCFIDNSQRNLRTNDENQNRATVKIIKLDKQSTPPHLNISNLFNVAIANGGRMTIEFTGITRKILKVETFRDDAGGIFSYELEAV